MKTLKSRFLINHVGFLPKASKHFSYKGVSKEFRVNRFQDLKLIPVFCGKLVDAEEGYKRGDFSEITEEGIYRISTEEGNSRCFIISPNVYKTAERILVNYFTWQRCGDDLGWNGKCHTEDAITLQNGEVLNLSGGHHQSSDLRKWTFGTSIGIAGLAEFALREQPLWDRGILAEELWHAAEYYLKLITKEGWLISCTWVPEGYDVEKAGIGYGDYAISWEKRQFFEIPDNEHSHWQTIKTLALIGKYFRDKDVEKWERCINGAEKIWEYAD